MLGDVLEMSQGAKDNLSWPPGPHMLLGMVWGREKSQEGLSGNFQRGARYQKMHRHSAGKYGREEPPLGKARQVLRPRKEKCQRMVALGSCKWGVRRRLQS